MSYDLFGEIPVSEADVEWWLKTVPRMEPGTKRARYYVHAWNVADKIRAAKKAGTWRT